VTGWRSKPHVSGRSVATALVLTVGLIVVTASPLPAEHPARSIAGLSPSIQKELDASPFGIPLLVSSEEGQGRLSGEVLGVLERPFEEVTGLLSQACSWCDIGLLHLNTKACGCVPGGVTLYAGRKHYQEPGQAERIDYRFSRTLGDGHLAVVLESEGGPLGTTAYSIVAEASPLDTGRTLLRFRYGHGYGIRARVAMQAYLATLGSGKQGLSTEGVDAQGKPVPTSGMKGVIERNALRYYYAVQAVLETRHLPEERRMADAARAWFELTQRHPQLWELSMEEYLGNKTREIENSRSLHRQPETRPDPHLSSPAPADR
jgi:hypothetical protein